MTEYWPLYELIKRFEGLRLKAYVCPAGVWTCGYGSTGPDINQHTSWTLAQAEARMMRDCDKFIRAAKQLCPDADDVQLCAIASFAYNVGIGALKSSTFRRVFNRGDIEGAKKQLLRWNRAGGKVLKGLTRRRQAEAELL